MDERTGAGEPAGIGRRLAACVYDALAVAAVGFGATILLLPLTGGEAISNESGALAQWAYRAYLLGAVYAYFAFSWRRGGQTLGMRAWRLRVRDEAGGTPGWSQTVIRFAGAIVSFVPLGLGHLWVAFDPDRRAWHDGWSGTVVRHEPSAH